MKRKSFEGRKNAKKLSRRRESWGYEGRPQNNNSAPKIEGGSRRIQGATAEGTLIATVTGKASRPIR